MRGCRRAVFGCQPFAAAALAVGPLKIGPAGARLVDFPSRGSGLAWQTQVVVHRILKGRWIGLGIAVQIGRCRRIQSLPARW